jgi:hypothetical protein
MRTNDQFNQRSLVRQRVLVGALLGGLFMVSLVAASEPDWNEYDQLLKRYVLPGERAGVQLNQVDYGGLASDPKFAKVIAELAAFPLENLANREEKLSFYINAYNALAINMVVSNLPLESIKDVGNVFKSVWKRPAGMLGGRSISLDTLEHDILRKMNEPRIHFAIVCASVSCPDLRTEAYVADRLDAQLDDQCRRFLNNPGKGLRESNDGAQVSKIFKWFEQDFESAGGIGQFIRRYHPLPEAAEVHQTINYDWSLNGR